MQLCWRTVHCTLVTVPQSYWRRCCGASVECIDTQAGRQSLRRMRIGWLDSGSPFSRSLWFCVLLLICIRWLVTDCDEGVGGCRRNWLYATASVLQGGTVTVTVSELGSGAQPASRPLIMQYCINWKTTANLWCDAVCFSLRAHWLTGDYCRV